VSPSQPRRSLKTFSLRLWLPLSLVITCGLIFLVLLVLAKINYDREMQHFVNHVAHEELLRAQRDLEAAFRRQDNSGLGNVIGDLGLNPAISHAAVVDGTGVVLAATQLAWRGQDAVAVVPDYAASKVAQTMQARHEYLVLDMPRRSLIAMAPVALALRPGEIRTGRQGVLYIAYDLSPVSARIWKPLQEQAMAFAAVMVFATLGLAALVRKGVIKPVQALRESMECIGAGGLSVALPQWQGDGEFRDLGVALDGMAQALQASSRALFESEIRYRQLSDAALEALFLYKNGQIIDANAAANRLLRVEPGALVDRSMLSLVAPQCIDFAGQRILQGMEGVWEIELIDAQGNAIPCECSVQQRIVDGHAICILAARDIRQRLAAQAAIRKLAHFDPLTGLHNRRWLLDQITQELVEVEHHNHHAALVTINLNAFQAVNSSLGMAAGDSVLRTMARRLSSLQEQGQTLARVDRDTFAILLVSLEGSLDTASAQVVRSVERLLAAIGEPLKIQDQVLHLSADAGVVMIPNDSRDPPELLREAETAMYLAKQVRDGHVRFFSHVLQEAASAKLALRNDLRSALQEATHGKAGQLVLHYQPQVDKNGQLLGVEALVRWQHPTRGLLQPGAFIAEAEASGLIVPLGAWVLKEAALCLRRWQSAADTQSWANTLIMAVNVSQLQFRKPNFVACVEEILASTGIQAHLLELELTESVLSDDLEDTLEKMQMLRRLGVRFALDDFGVGYSSLAYLRQLPIDRLKIDRSFVLDADAPLPTTQGKHPMVLIGAIVSVAHQLNLCVVAEGVETPSLLACLKRVDCDSFQGYYFSRPLPEENLIAWVAKHQPTA
jgi:diguanylate cyclase (GGDEF)-like protein/PAS domain S-box-containing protein